MRVIATNISMHLLLLALCVAAVSCDRIKGTVEKADFEAYKAAHGKVYASAETEAVHRQIYEDNVKMINNHNALYDQGEYTYYMGVNPFTDWTQEQRDARNGYKAPETPYTGEVRNGDPLTAPESMDWRDKGAVQGVKDQGHCGSCWAFGAVGSMEGAYAIAHGELPNGAEQELVSCDVGLACHGCNGGNHGAAMDWVKSNGDNGIDTQESYPYTAADDKCQTEKTKDGQDVALTIGGHKKVAISEAALTEAVGNVGPVAVAIYVNEKFQHYEGGIFDDLCLGLPNHAVLAVGYTSEYWIIKNSWSTSWGEEGYIRMKKGKDICFIVTQAYYATI